MQFSFYSGITVKIGIKRFPYCNCPDGWMVILSSFLEDVPRDSCEVL